jgi:NADH dehydrogenase
MSSRAHVVIVGAGFGGLACARALARAELDVTVVDRQNHHLFQPLLYQVAISALTPSQIAVPIRSILRRQRNARVLLAEVAHIDLEARRVAFDPELDIPSLRYDYLVLAPGSTPNYFGQAHWAWHAPALKSVDDALEIRRRVLLAFEAAELEADPNKRAQVLSFVIVGGGPSGVETAAAIAELARSVLERDYHWARASDVRVLVIERGPRLLPSFCPELAERAVARLAALGVHVRTQTIVESVEPWGVCLRSGERLRADTVIWAAGMTASPLLQALTPAVALDRQARAVVREDCSLPAFGEVFVIGDSACLFGALGSALPSVSAAARQAGEYVGKLIGAEVKDSRPRARPPFAYVDRGQMVTLGRGRAIAQFQRRQLSGRSAWWVWLLNHIMYLADFGQRGRALLAWTFAYFSFGRGARVITGEGSPLVAASEPHAEVEAPYTEPEDSQVRMAR